MTYNYRAASKGALVAQGLMFVFVLVLTAFAYLFWWLWEAGKSLIRILTGKDKDVQDCLAFGLGITGIVVVALFAMWREILYGIAIFSAMIAALLAWHGAREYDPDALGASAYLPAFAFVLVEVLIFEGRYSRRAEERRREVGEP